MLLFSWKCSGRLGELHLNAGAFNLHADSVIYFEVKSSLPPLCSPYYYDHGFWGGTSEDAKLQCVSRFGRGIITVCVERITVFSVGKTSLLPVVHVALGYTPRILYTSSLT
jgi:hypothetical protein